jgi:hypothetical protein
VSSTGQKNSFVTFLGPFFSFIFVKGLYGQDVWFCGGWSGFQSLIGCTRAAPGLPYLFVLQGDSKVLSLIFWR